MREDAELVEMALGGDQASFAELYERYFDRVYDFLARMVRDRDEAADLAQDTFVRALNNLSSLDKGGSFKSWLFTIARNTALNRLERAGRTQPLERRASSDDDGFEMDVIDEDRYGNPEEAAEVKSYASLVWEAAASLDPKQYAVLDLSVRQQFSAEEMAEALGVTKNNAYVMVNRMKKALEDAIGSLVLLREGRRQCRELEAALADLQVAEMTPEVRRTIDRHAAKCDECGQRRRSLASPFGIFAGFGLLQPAADARAAIFESLNLTYGQVYGGGAAAASEAAATSPDLVALEPGLPGASPGPLPGRAGAGRAREGGEGGDDDEPPDGTAAGGQGRPGSWKLNAVAAVLGALLVIGGGFLLFTQVLETSESADLALQTRMTPVATVPAAASLITATPQVTAASVQATETAAASATAVVSATAEASVTPEPEAPAALVEVAPTEGPAAAPPPTEPPALQEPPTAVPEPPTETPVPPTTTPLPPTPEPPTATPVPPSPTPCVPNVTADPPAIDFGPIESTQVLSLYTRGCGQPAQFTLVAWPSWVLPSSRGGTIAADGRAGVTLMADRSQLPRGQTTQGVITVQIVAAGATWNLNIGVSASMPVPQ